MNDLISIVVPVYNVEKYVEESLKSLLNQTYKNIEVICVDDGSSDSSLSILKNIAESDNRVKIVEQKNAGAGAARNNGINYANGKYIYFFDSDDIAAKNLLEKAYNRAQETDADIVAFNGYTFTDDDISTKKLKKGYNSNIIKDKNEIFSYKTHCDCILSIVNVVPWNKLIKTELIKKNNLKFEEISSSNDITFSAVCSAYAQRIAVVNEALMYYRLGHSGTVSSTKQKNLGNVERAVESVVEQTQALPYYKEIKTAVQRFVIDNYTFAFMNYTNDFTADIAKGFYEHIRKRFQSELFDGLTKEALNNEKLFALFEAVKNASYEQMLERRLKKIIVSFTTYPKRISSAHKIVENMLSQSLKAEKILLYLAEEQFPNKEKDLPKELTELQGQGAVEIKWCDDLRSHKKYFYAMQEYPENLIVTVDDDLVYPGDMLQSLYYSYLCFPNCVSAMRAHITVIDKSKKDILPYSKWFKEYREHILTPSSQLFATSGAGTLYPPHSLNELAFDKEKIKELCPFADDIWLNANQLLNGTQTVCAVNNFYLNYIDETQEESLFEINVAQNQNEIQYDRLRTYLKEQYSCDILYERLADASSQISFGDIESVCRYVEYLDSVNLECSHKLKTAYTEKSEINSKLQKTYKEKAERGEKIKKLNSEMERLKEIIKTKNEYIEKLKKYSFYPIYKRLKKLFKRK